MPFASSVVAARTARRRTTPLILGTAAISAALVIVAAAPATAAPTHVAARPVASTPHAASGKVLLKDNFTSVPAGRTLTDGDPVGSNWHVRYAGFGSVIATNHPALRLTPAVSKRQNETHAALVTTNRSFGDIDATVSMRTDAQLRKGSAPNPWEAAWLLWHYTDDNHFYSLVLKPNGWELGKEDPAYPGSQRYLATGNVPVFPTGAWYKVRVRQVGPSMTVWVNGKQLVSFTDKQRPYASGHLGLYNEDAQTSFTGIEVQRVP
ncbi:MAG: hypothetical protein BGO26_16370 [Actinobacteria bacterium 69-20]|jgi:hypothetical protein|nr:DUF1080 domain-containing protein [Actinomycetota bacterium]OJV27859.1 MAG: hypothetical protein BGO26_16370 [Actinobacteria bacterium 69-20]